MQSSKLHRTEALGYAFCYRGIAEIVKGAATLGFTGPEGVRHRREYRQFDQERRTLGELSLHIERDLVRPP